MKGHGMSTAHISAFYTLHQLCNCLVHFMCSPNALCHYMAHLCISAMAKCCSLLWMWFHFMVTNMMFHMTCVCTLVHKPPSDGNINTCHMLSNIYIPFPILPHFCPSPPPPPQQNSCCDLQRDPCLCVYARCVTTHSLYLKPLLTKQ